MSKLRVQSFAISIDGYGAGPNQDLQNPLGVSGPELMEWFFHTRVWRKMHGQADGETGVDNEMAEQGFAGIGAWILGRNMFGPVRGPWPDDSWKGWWGEEPPYHTPVFVLTHHARPPLKWREEPSFASSPRHTGRAGAGEGGGRRPRRPCRRRRIDDSAVSARRLIDELCLAIRPVLLGSGEQLLNGMDLRRSVTNARGTSPANARCTSSCANVKAFPLQS